MKKILLMVAIIVSTTLIFNQCNSLDSKTSTNDISFYKVPLVCGAAPDIGCGSRSKPVLIGLEEQKEISEAWLNRSGAIIAIVWNRSNDLSSRNNATDEIFKKNKINVKEIDENEYTHLLKDFENKKDWYRSEEVDELSKEEASLIAARLIARTNLKTTLTNTKIVNLKREITGILITRFTKKYSYKINDKDAWSEEIKKKHINELLEAGKKYLDENEIKFFENAITLGLGPTEYETKNSTHSLSSKRL